MPPDVSAEFLVSETVDERTEQTWKHICKQEGGEEDRAAIMGPSGE